MALHADRFGIDTHNFPFSPPNDADLGFSLMNSRIIRFCFQVTGRNLLLSVSPPSSIYAARLQR